MLLAVTRSINEYWNRWITPSETVTNPDERKQLRLLTSLLLGSTLIPLPLTTLLDLLGVYGETNLIKFTANVTGIICTALLYYLAKRGHYTLTSRLFVAFIMGFVFLLAASSPEENSKINVLYYGILVIFVSNLFLDFQTLIITLIAQLVLLLIYGALVPDVIFEELIIGPFVFHFVMMGVISVVIFHRERIHTAHERIIRLSEERYRKTSELISDYAFSYRLSEVSGQRHELIWSTGDTYASITGYSMEEREQLPLFAIYHPDDVARFKTDLQKVLDGETVRAEYRIVTKSGEIQWVEITRKPTWNETKEKIAGFYGVARNITDRKNDEMHTLEMELQKQRASLLGELVRAISHDFRTSVATIETSRYLIERKLPESERESIQPRLDIIQSCISHLTEQLDNLRTVHAVTELHLEPSRVNDLIDLVTVQQDRLAREKGVTLIKNVAKDIPLCYIDQQEFKVALDNLIKNALHHTPKGGTVTLGSMFEDDRVRIDISDTGSGIEEEQRPHIFDLFYRGDSARSLSSGGVGLGLTIVKMIIEAHKGTITVDSTLGEGSTFIIRLPKEAIVETVKQSIP